MRYLALLVTTLLLNIGCGPPADYSDDDDNDLHIQVNAPDHPQLDAGEEYEVDLWIVDDAGHDSNRIGEVGWTAPTANCQ